MVKGEIVKVYLFGAWVDAVFVEMSKNTASIIYEDRKFIVSIENIKK
jgi:hypothetical protein